MSTIAVTNLKHESAAGNNIVLDDAGNVGIGTDPSAWSGFDVVDFDGNNGVASQSNGNLYLANNLYYDGSNWRYKSDGIGILVALSRTGSAVIKYVAASGTAGNTATVTEVERVDTSGNLKFNSGYGSVATAYGCRAWVNFNGTGTVAIRASGNVSSITDNGTGNYTVNFATAMPDANYAAVATSRNSTTYGIYGNCTAYPYSASATDIKVGIEDTYSGESPSDAEWVSAAFFR